MDGECYANQHACCATQHHVQTMSVAPRRMLHVFSPGKNDHLDNLPAVITAETG